LYVADRAMRFAREVQHRGLVLAELLERGDAATRHCLESAGALGWQLFGWHTAVQVGLVRSNTTVPVGTLISCLEAELRRDGTRAGVVPRQQGPAFWLSWQQPPTPVEITALARTIRRVLLNIERDVPGLEFYAGIGGAHPGIAGIATSMQEAQQAFVLARSRDVHAAVEVMDARAVKRILLGWYPAGPLRDSALSLVEPLIADDATGELSRTLRCYLDHESSITSTAAILGVHRNTVIHRLRRIRALLQVDLDQPEERLAVHLALRLVQSDPAVDMP
jgi:purine catabolism regulator